MDTQQPQQQPPQTEDIPTEAAFEQPGEAEANPTAWQGDEDAYANEPAFEPIQWATAEFIEHEKDSRWYMMYALGIFFIAALIYLVTREILATVIVIFVAGTAAFFSSRPAQTRNYEINEDGIKIDKRQFVYEDFKSFSVVEEGPKDSIWLKPIKRFVPFTIIYFEPKDEENIIMALSAFLPHEERELDKLDQLTRKLRF